MRARVTTGVAIILGGDEDANEGVYAGIVDAQPLNTSSFFLLKCLFRLDGA